MINKILLTLCFYLSGFLFAHLEANLSSDLNYTVERNDYRFSTVFELASENKLISRVYKSPFHITTNYDLYDCSGEFQARGIYRFFCLGLFYTWGTEIDIYDASGERIGFIDGQTATSERAKFSIYNKNGIRVGIAYLDQDCEDFTIVDPHNGAHLLVNLRKSFEELDFYSWDVQTYEPEAIDPIIVQIFSVFACDTQYKFKPRH